jgi:hypothetical protein
MNVINNIDDIHSKKQKKEQQTSTSNIDVKHYQIMNSTDNESDDDDDSELLNTLSQLHGIVNPIQFLEKTNEVQPQMSYYSPDINQEKIPLDLLSENRINNGNETELLNEKKQVWSHIKLTSPYVIDTMKQSDEEQEEKNEKKNVIIYKNHNDVNGDDKQKEKYERIEEEKAEKKPTTSFSLTSSTSSILFNDDSHSSIDSDASFFLPNLLLLLLNVSNDQLITDDSQISTSKSTMSNLPNDELNKQTTSSLFDPFDPTTTTTTMIDDSKNTEEKNQTLTNYNFDDLWNQSMSHIESSNNNIDPSTFEWNAFFNTEEKTNSSNDNTTKPTTDITWDSLFNKEQDEKNDLKNFLNWILDHLNDSEQPIITFTSINNLESIIKDIQMNSTPFDPIPSPPLHIDHTVSNPMINAIHHELFPIDEIENPNRIQEQQSMTLYEEDEEQEQEKENTKLSSFDDDVKPTIEKLVSDILQLALIEINNSYEQIEHFVDQILTQAIFEVYTEDENTNIISTENLASIISSHDQTNKQLFDPFDQKFDSIWSKHFQAPDDTTTEDIFENENKNDPWLTTTTTTESNKSSDPMSFFSKNFNDSDLFSSSNNSTDQNNETTTTNNLMKYTLTAPVIDDSGDDNSTLEDYFISRKVINYVFLSKLTLILFSKSFLSIFGKPINFIAISLLADLNFIID